MGGEPDPIDVFISYRRGASTPYAGRLRDALADRYGDGHVFMDMDSILPGTEWDEAIRESVKRCRVLLAVIGRGWANVKDAEDRRRLEDPGDFVRLEIESALGGGVAVIPILLHGTRMPKPEQLPGQLRDLARRQAMTVRDETWRSDVVRLLEAVEHLGRRASAPGPAESPVQPDPERQAPAPTELGDEIEPAPLATPRAGRPITAASYISRIAERLDDAEYEPVDADECAGASAVFVKRVSVGEQTMGFAARAVKERDAKRLFGAYTGEHLEVAVVVREFGTLSELELSGFMQQAKTCTEALLDRHGTRMRGAFFAVAVAVTRHPSGPVIRVASEAPKIQTKGATVFPVIVDLGVPKLHYFQDRTFRWLMLSSIQHIPDRLLAP